jgi:Flp pilus assembly pilin Flp
MSKLVQFLMEEEGTEVVEWALILLLVIILVIAAVTIVGQKTSQAWQSVAASMAPS